MSSQLPLSSASAHIGTSSWQFDAWRGVFYPEKTSGKAYLDYYVTQFDTVEVNTSFYALPRASTVLDWVEAAPPGFSFALKAPRAITHDKKLQGAESETLAYLDVLRSLGSAAAPGLIQLPPELSRKNDGRPLAAFLDWLAPLVPDLRLAVEVRAADLMTPAFAAFLAERGFALVMVERKGTPDLFPLWEPILASPQLPPFTFIRWIGDDRTGPQGDRAIQTPRDAELVLWAERIAAVCALGVEVYGYMHNPYEGHAPASVRRLQEQLRARSVAVGAPGPPPRHGEEDDSGQLALF